MTVTQFDSFYTYPDGKIVCAADAASEDKVTWPLSFDREGEKVDTVKIHFWKLKQSDSKSKKRIFFCALMSAGFIVY